jgi:hypothetical protein
MGYISKSLLIDTHIPKGREEEDFVRAEPEIILNKQPDEAEITYTQPVGKFKYDVYQGDFDYDKDYAATAVEAQKRAEAHPVPKPKPPAPNPRITPPPPPTTTTPKSNPVPVIVKQPEYKPEPPKPKVVPPPVVTQDKPIIKNKTEKIIQKDRLKITLVTVTINGFDYEYRKEEYAWGGTYYYKDVRNITASAFDKETE